MVYYSCHNTIAYEDSDRLPQQSIDLYYFIQIGLSLVEDRRDTYSWALNTTALLTFLWIVRPKESSLEFENWFVFHVKRKYCTRRATRGRRSPLPVYLTRSRDSCPGVAGVSCCAASTECRYGYSEGVRNWSRITTT